MRVAVTIDRNACDLCGTCVEVCPTNVFTKAEEGLRVDSGRCIYCRGCEALCPRNAIRLNASDEGLRILIRNVGSGSGRARQATLTQSLKQNNTYNPTNDKQNGAGVA